MAETYERVRWVRPNSRYQWEKDRARWPEERRARSGATEHDTGLASADLVFHARYRQVPADPDLAAAFGVAAGTVLVERTYRTRPGARGAPLGLVTSRLVREMVAANPDLLTSAGEPWPGGTPHQLATVGIELDRVEDRVTARPPTAEEAHELALPPGASVLLLRKTSFDTAGRVVEVADVTLPGDRTELVFTTPLLRW
ncbi:hypothetical protein GCM10018793_55410 [Streptomyces sulfonofaciens]|uniref:UbiC transcription regulator-associated domain-containing protein n=1 Tax=Streptomyces sulfonofaciens TaxID=68272 RepID=A0A919L5R5_9ACTN|nr:UTRA domain-containing protein [Streptomyces sulfonofaciens]GHH85855.1 hypothetical protein GCM10018793_55410 [Streptomyces sulfonofaciens]